MNEKTWFKLIGEECTALVRDFKNDEAVARSRRRTVSTRRVDFPEWALCCLEYGERDGLTDEEISQVDEYLAGMRAEGYCEHWVTDERNEFCSSPEFGLACATVKVVFVKREVL